MSAKIHDQQRETGLTSEPQRPVATTLTRTCLDVRSFGIGLSSYENCLVGLSTKDVVVSIVDWVGCGAKLSAWPFEGLESGSCAEVAMALGLDIEIMATVAADCFHFTDHAISLAPLD